jgi:hypothetical protein
LHWKKITVAKSKEVKTGFNTAESCNESYGSRRPILPVMMMMMMSDVNKGAQTGQS